ncbi:histidine kinase dimerization/phosphoacceptor domain -containing protein [Gallaecimonas sp. GXIMD4217]|uniref:sensor histidine kinase n=1 Tax=Gallaecimonas sp. GXIMD4217 TaxID=3131927 RepID=UPI00311AEEF0
MKPLRCGHWAAAILLLSSLLVMLGWFLESQVLVTLNSQSAMRFNTALGFLLLGLALLDSRSGSPAGFWLPLALLLVLALATGLQYLAVINLGLDELFIKDWTPPEQGLYPGRMSPATIIAFLLSALALTGLGSTSWLRLLSWIPATVVAVICAFTLAARLFGGDSILSNFSSGMAPHTALAFMVASLSLLHQANGRTDAAARRLMLPLSALAAMMTLTGLGWYNSGHLERLDKARLRQERIESLERLANQRLAVVEKTLLRMASRWQVRGRTPESEWRLDARHYLADIPELQSLAWRDGQGRLAWQEGEALPAAACTDPDRRLHQGLLLFTTPLPDGCLHAGLALSALLEAAWTEQDRDFNLALYLDGQFLQSSRHWQPGPSEPVARPLRLGPLQLMAHVQAKAGTALAAGDQGARLILGMGLLLSALVSGTLWLLLLVRRRNLELEHSNGRLAASESQSRTLLEMAPEAVILVDQDGIISYANRRTRTLFGYEQLELLGQPVEVLIPAKLRDVHRRHRHGFAANPKLRDMGSGLELKAQRHNGKTFPVDVILSPIKVAGAFQVMAIVRDVSEKKAAERQIKASLHEKEVLLKEVYHRVKNNMQVIASLLRMQSRSAEDPGIKDKLGEAACRVRAMALVHEKLYQSKKLSRVDSETYVNSLIDDLQLTLGRQGQIKVHSQVLRVELEPDVLIPLGLIINELISNSHKHAFADGQKGEVHLRFTQDGGDYCLTIWDTGPGLPDDFSPTRTPSLGLKLVNTLVSQLHGRLDWGNKGGATFSIRFPVPALPTASPMVKELKHHDVPEPTG